jgi:hypothetical protein
LAGFIAIEAAEDDAAPGWINRLINQGGDGTVAGSTVVTPEQMDWHGEAERTGGGLASMMPELRLDSSEPRSSDLY